MAYTNFNWILDNLAVGAMVEGPDELPFDAILSLETIAPANLRDLVTSGEMDYQWHSITDGVMDAPYETIVAHFNRAADQIHAWVSQDKRTLVHCFAGISRAPTTATWYLVRHRGMTWDEALATIERVRPIVRPYVGFEVALRLESGERLTEEWLQERVAAYVARIKRDLDLDVDPARYYTELEASGTLDRLRESSLEPSTSR